MTGIPIGSFNVRTARLHRAAGRVAVLFALSLLGATASAQVPPSITTHPQSQEAVLTFGVSFDVTAAGTPPFGYQWQKGGSPIAGATSASYAITNLQFIDAGNYSVVVTNDFGGATSSNAVLTVLDAAADADGDGLPNGWEATHGLDFNNPADAAWDSDGDGMINEAEYLAGTNPTQASSRLAFTGIALVAATACVDWLSSAGETYVIEGSADRSNWSPAGAPVIGTGGSMQFCGPAFGVERYYRLVLQDGPTYSANLVRYQSFNVPAGNTNATTNLFVSADQSIAGLIPAPPDGTQLFKFNGVGFDAFTYLAGSGWLPNGTTLLEPGGWFIVQPPSGFTLRLAGEVVTPPQIVTQPVGGAANAGTNLTLFAVASGNAPLSYQWRKAGADVAGATNAIYSIANFQVADAGDYRVVVTNAYGSVTSAVATVTFSPPAVSYVWNGGNANWTSATNWIPNGVPGSADSATITNGTVTVSDSRAVANLAFSGGTLAGTGTLTVTNVMNWTDGTMTASGTTFIPAGGTLQMSGAANKVLQNGRRLSNAGTATWTGTGILGNGLNSFAITNSGVFDIQTDAEIYDPSGTASFNNTGILRKSASAGTNALRVSVTSSGTVDVQTGMLDFRSVATFNDGSLIIGAGVARLGSLSSTYTLAGTIYTTNLLFSDGAWAGTNTIVGHLRWTGGGMYGPGTTVIPPGSLLTISGSTLMTLNTSRVLSNAGTVVWTGTGNIRSVSGSNTINNSGLFDIQNDRIFDFGGSAASIYNTGTFRKSAGTGTNTVEFSFNNSGTVEVQIGILDFVGSATFNDGSVITGAGVARLGAISTTYTLDGTINTANLLFSAGTWAGTNTIVGHLDWTGGTMSGPGTTLIAASATLAISGSGSKLIRESRVLNNAGTVIWTGAGTIGNASVSGLSTITNSGLFDVQTDAPFAAGGGPWSVVNTGIFRKSAGAGTNVFNATFDNTGTVEVLTGGFDFAIGASFGDGSVITGPGRTRLSSGTFSVDGTIYSTNLFFSAGTWTGTNSIVGQMDWTGGTMSGPGTTLIPAGSTLNMSGNGQKTFQTNWVLSNAGTVIFAGTGLIRDIGAASTIVNSGLFDIQNDAQFDDTSGGALTIDNSGIFRKSAGTGITSVEFAFNNTGTVEARSGWVRFTRAYTMSPSSTNSVHIGGLTAGTQYGQIQITGAVTLDGQLNVQLVNGFTPSLGNTFTVMTYGSFTDTFDALTGDGQYFDPQYNPTALVLNTTSLPPVSISGGLVAYWPLDFVQGNVTPDVVGGYDLQLVNLTAANLVAGQRGNAFQFSSASQQMLERLHAAGEDLPIYAHTNFSVSMWVNGPPNQNDLRVFAEASTISNNPLFTFGTTSASGALDLFVRGDSSATFVNHLNSAQTVFDGTWHHWVYVQRESNSVIEATLYVDGIMDSVAPAPQRPLTLDTTALGGIRRAARLSWFDGRIDEVAVWKRALSQVEINQLFTNGVPVQTGPPVLATQPLGTNVAAGATLTLAVTASGAQPLFYQWRFNGAAIPGAYNRVLSFTNGQPTASGGYSVIVSNASGSVTSDVATVTVNAPAMFTEHPQSQTVVAGSNVTFRVSATGTFPLGFTWHQGGVPLVTQVLSEPSAALLLFNAQPADAGAYHVVLTNAAVPAPGVSSGVAVLTVLSPVAIGVQPTNVTAAVAGRAEFCVGATGTGPLQYQWRHNGANIADATNACLVIDPVALADGGTYSVLLENPAGTLTSDEALLSIAAPAVPGADAFANRTDLGNAATGLVGGSNSNTTPEPPGEPEHAGKPGGRSVWYRWTAPAGGIATFRTVGSAFDTLLAVYTGAGVNALTVVAADEDSGGAFTSEVTFNAVAGQEYAIVVDGFAGATGDYRLSWNLAITADVVPVITIQPASQTVNAGANASFNVQAQGQGLSYQWYFNGQPILNATSPTLNVSNAQADDLGAYVVIVSNGTGRSATSAEALLEIGALAAVQSEDKFEDVFGGTTAGGAQPAGPRRRSGVTPVSAGALVTQHLNNFGATTEADEPNHGGVVGGASKWFDVLPETTGVLVLDTLGSDIDTVLAVYTGTNLFTLRLVVQDDNGAPDGLRSRVRFAATGGTHYLVAVDGVGGAQGDIRLNVRLGQPPNVPVSTPTNAVVEAGAGFLLSAPAGGGGDAQYQWRRDGEAITGATNATFMVADAGAGDGGEYAVAVRNDFGEIERTVADVDVDVPLLGRTPEVTGGELRVTVQRPEGQAVVVEATGDLVDWWPLGTVPYTLTGPAVTLPMTNAWQFLRARPWP